MENLNTIRSGSSFEMTERFLRSRGIKNEKVLAAMAKVPRHHFVPESFRSHAYSDSPLPIGFEQTISQPFVVGLMTQALIQNQGQRFLEIGTGSGYQTAILAEVAKSVFSIERIFSFVPVAKARLEKLGYHNVSITVGDGAHGWVDYAPFDGIIVTAAVKAIPDAWFEQLVEGGTLVLPLEDSKGLQMLYTMTKHGQKIAKREMGSCRFVPFITT
ncbi:MAG: protein-L-isoaspartate(D-aspartate) O-methyltransferase [Bdellovibrionales bacterium]|nr:protein-L-isoaspartate(D-aspartate) O-methyltransferase [Bdellovibrionales bacterium]